MFRRVGVRWSSVAELARRPQRPVHMRQMLSWGSEGPSSRGALQMQAFLLEELPVRLARRVVELETLPHGLSRMPSVQRVHAWYESSVRDILEAKTQTPSQFQETLIRILNKHNDVVPSMARGIIELKQQLAPSEREHIDEDPFLQDFLDRFFMARIGLRVLIGNFVALSSPRPGFNGMFETHCPVARVVQIAAEEAASICSRVYGITPHVQIKGKLDLKTTYIPEHIHHIMFELLKNSMRASVESAEAKKRDVHDIEVVLADGDVDIAIKISDRGGGIPRKNMKKVFAYAYTTVKTPPAVTSSGASSPQMAGLTHVPMAGYGYGLPLSRLYAHTFGGDLVVISLDGHGTDAFLFLNKLHESTEIVPK